MSEKKPIVKDDKKDALLEDALKQIEKQYGKGSIMKLGDRANVDIDAIKTIVGDENVEVGCIGQCGQEFVAYINDELIETSTEEETGNLKESIDNQTTYQFSLSGKKETTISITYYLDFAFNNENIKTFNFSLLFDAKGGKV